MAGVGFELKKLFTARTAAGHIKAYTYSAIITAGPFALMTGMVMAVQLLFGYYGISAEASRIFVASVVYAFVMSSLLQGSINHLLPDQAHRGHFRSTCFWGVQHPGLLSQFYFLL